MKKIITFLVAIAFATTAFPLITFHGGGNLSQLTGHAYPSSIFGGQIGITTFSSRLFSVQPGVFLISKGGGSSAGNTRLNYLEIPVNMMLGYNINESLRLVLGAGLYCSFGLWGHSPGGSIDFFSDTDRHHFVDFGWQVSLNAFWGRYGARISYSRGFTHAVDVRPRPRNSTFAFGVSYTLGGDTR